MFALEKHMSAVWDMEASSLNKEASQLEGYRQVLCLSVFKYNQTEWRDIRDWKGSVCCVLLKLKAKKQNTTANFKVLLLLILLPPLRTRTLKVVAVACRTDQKVLKWRPHLSLPKLFKVFVWLLFTYKKHSTLWNKNFFCVLSKWNRIYL